MLQKKHLVEYYKNLRESYIDKKFGKLTIIEVDGRINNSVSCKCLCECGKFREKVNISEMKRGFINSCGCTFPKGHKRPCKSREEYHEHVKNELISRRNIVEDCWEYTGQIDHKGYGRRTFTIDRKKSKKPVSQIAYILWNGEIIDNKYVCHTCDNRKCFNPKHLWLGTAKENLEDMIKKGRGSNRKGENNPKSKLTIADVINIRNNYENGVSMSCMAREKNVTTACIDYICKRKTWKHI